MLKNYWDITQQIIFHDPQHAWIFLSLLYIIVTLLVQTLFTGPVKKVSKRISVRNLKPIHDKYLFRSIFGWLVYLLSLGFFLLFWYAHYFHSFDLQSSALVLAAASTLAYLLSIIFLMAAYATSCLDQIKLLEDKQLTP